MRFVARARVFRAKALRATRPAILPSASACLRYVGIRLHIDAPAAWRPALQIEIKAP